MTNRVPLTSYQKDSIEQLLRIGGYKVEDMLLAHFRVMMVDDLKATDYDEIIDFLQDCIQYPR